MTKVYLVDLEQIIRMANPRELHTEMNVVYWETSSQFIIEYAKDNGVIYRAEISKAEVRKTAPLESSDEHSLQVWEQHMLRANRFIKIQGEHKPDILFKGRWE